MLPEDAQKWEGYVCERVKYFKSTLRTSLLLQKLRREVTQ